MRTLDRRISYVPLAFRVRCLGGPQAWLRIPGQTISAFTRLFWYFPYTPKPKQAMQYRGLLCLNFKADHNTLKKRKAVYQDNCVSALMAYLACRNLGLMKGIYFWPVLLLTY